VCIIGFRRIIPYGFRLLILCVHLTKHFNCTVYAVSMKDDCKWWLEKATDAVAAYSEMLTKKLPGRTTQNHENFLIIAPGYGVCLILRCKRPWHRFKHISGLSCHTEVDTDIMRKHFKLLVPSLRQLLCFLFILVYHIWEQEQQIKITYTKKSAVY
jgi:hypothetical protein